MALIDQLERYFRDLVESKRPEIEAAIATAPCVRDHEGVQCVRYDIGLDYAGEIAIFLRITVGRYVRGSGSESTAALENEIAKAIGDLPGLEVVNVYPSVRTAAELAGMSDRQEWEPLPVKPAIRPGKKLSAGQLAEVIRVYEEDGDTVTERLRSRLHALTRKVRMTDDDLAAMVRVEGIARYTVLCYLSDLRDRYEELGKYAPNAPEAASKPEEMKP